MNAGETLTVGEKLTALQNIIYQFAQTKLSSSGLDANMAEIVMGNVYRRFQESAYHAAILNRLSESSAADAPAVESPAPANPQEVTPNVPD